MTTATQPQRPAHVPQEAVSNGVDWFTFNTTTGQWDLVPAAAAPTLPPLPAPGSTATNGQTGTETKDRPPPVYGSAAEFFNQQAFTGSEGKTWKFHQMPEGTWYEGIVARDVSTRGDVVAQTKPGTGEYIMQNGQYKWQLQVPMLMIPGGLYPDGKAVAIFKVGDSRDKLSAAMQHSGAPVTTDTLDDGTEVQGYLPRKGDYIRMTKVEDQQGRNAKGEGFTRYIYEVIHRCADDPYAQAFATKVMAAHRAMAEAGPPPEQPAAGSPAQAFIDYANALTAYQAQLAAATSGAITNGTPAPAATPAPTPAPVTPPLPQPSTPPAPPPSAGTTQLQTAANQVATADAGLPATTMPTPAPAPPVPPPATTPPANNTPPPGAPAPVATTPVSVAAPPASPPTITREQWQQMAPQVRHVVSQQTGIPIPEDLRQ